jgi:hypothetical protein
MESASRVGRIIGILLILQMVGSGIVNFALEAPLFKTPGFLVNATPHSQQIGLAVVLGLVIEAIWLGIAVAVFAIVFPRAQRTALFFVALAAAILAIAVAENAGVLSMVSLSGAYAKAGPVERTAAGLGKRTRLFGSNRQLDESGGVDHLMLERAP